MSASAEPNARREFSHDTAPLIRRLIGEFLRPHLGKMMLAFAAMGVVAAATAGNAWLMQPLLDKVFVEHDETLLLTIPVVIIALAFIKGFAGYLQSVLMTTVDAAIITSRETIVVQNDSMFSTGNAMSAAPI